MDVQVGLGTRNKTA